MTAQSPGAPAAPPPAAGGGFTVSWRAVAVALLAVVVGFGVVVGLIVLAGDDEASAAEVQLEPVSSTGQNPFLPSVGTDQANVAPPPQAGGQFAGDTPGLYGGTLNVASCDAPRMVTFLQQNPDKAAAWAGVLGISTVDIQTYVSDLTPVILRTDTSVTNHGFENGRATSIPAILEAGTAVFVDKYGFPVVKCYCGNPLTRPPVYKEPKYSGPKWSGFDPGGITIIQQTTIIIDTFTLVDPATGESFTRPRGGSGGSDQPSTPTPTPNSLPPAPQPAPEPPAPEGPSPEEQAIAIVGRASQECYPFPAPIEDSTGSSNSTEPGSSANSFVLQVVTQTGSGGTQVFRWEVDRNTLQFTAVNDLAQVASNHCPLLR